MSGHYEEREIKIVEVTYVCDNEFDCARHVGYELRAYNSADDEDYEVLAESDNLWDLFERRRR